MASYFRGSGEAKHCHNVDFCGVKIERGIGIGSESFVEELLYLVCRLEVRELSDTV